MNKEKVIKYLVMGMVAEHFSHLSRGGDQTISAISMNEYVQDTTEKVYSYLRTQNTSGSWSDLQCVTATEIWQLLTTGLRPLRFEVSDGHAVVFVGDAEECRLWIHSTYCEYRNQRHTPPSYQTHPRVFE